MAKGFGEFALSVKRLVKGQSVGELLALLGGLIDDYDEDAVGAVVVREVQLNLLRHQLSTVCKKRGKVLCEEGDDFAAALVVIAGQLLVSVKDEGDRWKEVRDIDGNDRIVGILGPGSVIGTEMLAEGVTSLYTIKTGADSMLWVLQREAYQQYLTVFSRRWS